MSKALYVPCWRQAIVDEMTALHDNDYMGVGFSSIGAVPRWLPLGDTVNYFSDGIEVAQTKEGSTCPKGSVLDILEDTGLMGIKPIETPMDPNARHRSISLEPVNGSYVIGRIEARTASFPLRGGDDFDRPPTTTTTLAQVYANSSLDSHGGSFEDCATRQGISRSWFVFWHTRSSAFEAFTNADWARSPTDKRSTTWYYTFLGGNLITWESKEQIVVVRSSAETKYRAMAHTSCELLWLKHLLEDKMFEVQLPMRMYCNNQATIHIKSNPVFHKKPNTLRLIVILFARELRRA
ncbi:hypothetical protein Acr_29g0005530 [Actinidia rufa]|uniref:Uncharacterized protein n=1 Tax=Actinidia rufa TaxID=165716 RepID=A0A7J0HEK1_9ERIC|nr:hypothetical protein Acr_29g0005530 [Actinidia rufa]